MEQPDGAVFVLAEAQAKPGKREAVVAGFKRSQALAPGWEGCRQFDIAVSGDDDETVFVVERWDSAEQHKRHLAQVTSSEGFARFRELLAKDLSVRYLALR